jgi:hypothetical protein
LLSYQPSCGACCPSRKGQSNVPKSEGKVTNRLQRAKLLWYGASAYFTRDTSFYGDSTTPYCADSSNRAMIQRRMSCWSAIRRHRSSRVALLVEPIKGDWNDDPQSWIPMAMYISGKGRSE